MHWIVLVMLLAGCAVAPWTITPLTFGTAPYSPAYPPYAQPLPIPEPPPPKNPMHSHVRLPSCGQCHR